LQSIAGALAGLLFGGWLVSLHSRKSRNDLRYNPILVDSSAGPSSDMEAAIVQVR
jgi:positive regulator of sigma E activity